MYDQGCNSYQDMKRKVNNSEAQKLLQTNPWIEN